MCDWRVAKERTFVNHVRYCYPRTLTYLTVMVTLVLIVTLLDLWRGWV